MDVHEYRTARPADWPTNVRRNHVFARHAVRVVWSELDAGRRNRDGRSARTNRLPRAVERSSGRAGETEYKGERARDHAAGGQPTTARLAGSEHQGPRRHRGEQP